MQRSIVSLIVGAVLAVIAIALLYNYVGGLQGNVAAPAAPIAINIVVAGEDIPFGATVIAESLSLVRWPQESVPAGAFMSIDEIFAGDEGTGDRVTLIAIVAGEPVLRSKVSGFGERPILSRQVAEGMRALAIRIDDVIGVAGFVLPGDRVDILLTRTNTPGGTLAVADVVLQNIVVLGIDQSADQRTDQPIVARTATVEVTPEQAQKLVLAQSAGTLSLALRGVTTVDEIPVLQVNELNLSNRRPAGPVRPIVRVRNGNSAPVTRTVRP